MSLFLLSGKCLHKVGKRARWALFLFLSIVFLSGFVVASESAMWEVLSRYQSPIPMQPESEVKWQYKKEMVGNIATVSVSDVSKRLQCRIKLRYDEDGSLVWAESCRVIRGQEICSQKEYKVKVPALLSQTLIPGDCLNIDPQALAAGDWVKPCKIEDRVGATSFVDHITIKKEAVSIEQALAAGMLIQQNRQFAENKKLYTISLSRGEVESDGLVLRQLWAQDAKFWLYEVKDGRRSWYLGSK